MLSSIRWRHIWFREFFERLQQAYGPQHWWPADTPDEVAIGAILTQNTSWKNVEKAIAALKRADLIDWDRLCAVDESALAQVIRSAGTYRVKARRLRAFADAVTSRTGGSLAALLSGPLAAARRRLLAIHGIGRETADAILLYAGGRPSFVVDAYTRRILRRHHWQAHAHRDQTALPRGRQRPRTAPASRADREYDAIQLAFETALSRRADTFGEYHALLVTVGKRHCRTTARCEGCPLSDLPHDAAK